MSIVRYSGVSGVAGGVGELQQRMALNVFAHSRCCIDAHGQEEARNSKNLD